MKSKIILLASLTLVSMAAWAGYYQPAPVIIEYSPAGDAGFAGGDQTTAANSNNDVEFIGCGTRTFDDGAGGTFVSGFCQAVDADENRAFCNTNNPGLIDSMRSIAGRSYITFSWTVDILPDGTPFERCTRVGHSTQSFYLDKIKPSNTNNGKNDD